jgi:hypothetical protein
LYFFNASSLQIITAAAPSQIPLALPAVTVPLSLIKTAGNLEICSIVDCGRGCSSVSKLSSTPFFPLVFTGSISSLKKP